MQNILLILAVSAACAALVLSIAVTAVVIAFANTLKKRCASAQEQLKETTETETPAESDNTNEDVTLESNDPDESTAALISALEETNIKLDRLIAGQSLLSREENEKALALEQQNKELADRLAALEAENKSISAAAIASDARANERIRELEALANYKDSYYADITACENRLRACVSDALDTLIKARGSNSIDYLGDKIEKAIEILGSSRSLNE